MSGCFIFPCTHLSLSSWQAGKARARRGWGSNQGPRAGSSGCCRSLLRGQSGLARGPGPGLNLAVLAGIGGSSVKYVPKGSDRVALFDPVEVWIAPFTH